MIVRKVSPGTFVVGDLVDKDYVCPFKQPVSAERLVKLDMPELELEPGQPRRLELRETLQDDWGQYTIEKFGADGRVLIKLDGGGAQTRRWVDLTRCEYRWLQ